jgi:putative PIG3 family NAD(P)H quinone oxidoreductase
MKAVEITQSGGPEVLQLCERPVPCAGHGEVVIKLAYAGVNRPDVLQRAGSYAPPKGASDLPGLEGSGEVVEVGRGVVWPIIGDMVCALLPGGGYAEFVATPAAHCLPVPAGTDLMQAACLPENYFTVWSNMFMRGRLKAGERVLVHGGSSGIGTTAIQLANAAGARVFTTAGTTEKCAVCESLGAEQAINYRDEDFVAILKKNGRANMILDMVGGDYISRNISALADDGRLIQLAFLHGPRIAINFSHVMMRRLSITGSTLRPQSDLAKAQIAAELRETVWPLIETGRAKVVMDSEFALADVANAHARMERSAHIGKIVLRVNG